MRDVMVSIDREEALALIRELCAVNNSSAASRLVGALQEATVDTRCKVLYISDPRANKPLYPTLEALLKKRYGSDTVVHSLRSPSPYEENGGSRLAAIVEEQDFSVIVTPDERIAVMAWLLRPFGGRQVDVLLDGKGQLVEVTGVSPVTKAD